LSKHGLYVDVNADSLKSGLCEWRHSFSRLSVKTQFQNQSWAIGLSNHHNSQGKNLDKEGEKSELTSPRKMQKS